MTALQPLTEHRRREPQDDADAFAGTEEEGAATGGGPDPNSGED
jgi:hypothetical protein